MAGNSSNNLVNTGAATLAAQVANWAAQLEFSKEKMRLMELPEMQARIRQGDATVQLEIERLAWEKAQAAWKQAIEESSVTGKYQGQPTIEWLERQAKLTGVLNGQQTLEGALTQAQIAQMNASMANEGRRIVLDERKFDDDRQRFGLEFAYKQQQDRTQNSFQEAGITGYYGGQTTLQREQMQQDARFKQQELGLRDLERRDQGAQNYLQLLSSLQGNPFKAARVLGATPNGLQDLVSAWTGEYALPGTSGSGTAPGAPTLADLWDPYGTGNVSIPGGAGAYPSTIQQPLSADEMARYNAIVARRQDLAAHNQGDVGQADLDALNSYANRMGVAPPVPSYALRSAYGSAPAGESGGGYTYSPSGYQAPVDAYNYTYTPSGNVQVYPPGTPAPAQDPQVSSVSPQAPAYALRRLNTNPIRPTSLSPNQINAENYANTNKSSQDLMWQWFEDEQGWAPGAAQDAFQKSLPRYGGPQRGTVSAGLGF